jgi:hypothetical protein
LKKILIVGEESDPHIERVSNILTRLGANINFFNINNPSNYTVNIEYSNSSNNMEAFVNDLKFRFSEIDVVWWRIKPSILYPKNSKEDYIWSEFAYREWISVIDSFYFFMPNALWINPRNSNFNINEKVIQLFLAKQLGFNIPPTLISNDPFKISNFIEGNKKSIYKVLTWFLEYPNKLIFTSPVDSKKVIDSADSIKVCPGIFQREIEKSFEIRVTTVGRKIFSVKIDSQTLEETKLDWRRNQFEVPYSIYNLPNKMNELINKMNIKLGLHFAAYDFIVTPNDEFYFLEINPGGQWLWIEDKTNLQISKALAEYMINGQ